MHSNARASRIVGLLVLLSLAARLIYAIRLPIWFDEIFTQWLARHSAAGIFRGLRLDSGPPLSYLLEAPFARLAEAFRSDWLLRILPLASLAAIPLVALPRRSSAGPGFLLLAAGSPLLFFYSADARAYAPLAALSFLLFLAAFRSRGGKGSLAACALLSAALPWTHYLGLFVVASSLALTAAEKKGKSFLAQAAGASTFALWLPFALAQPPGSLAWSEEKFTESLWGAFEEYGFWGSYPGYLTGFRAPLPRLGALLGAALVLGSLCLVRRRKAIRESLGFALLPIALAALASFWRPIYFAGRTEMATLPVALWAFARASRHSRFLRYAIALAVVSGATTILFSLFAIPREPPYGPTARFLEERAVAGDAVVASDANYLPIRLFADRGSLRAALLGVPASIEAHPGWFEPGVLPDRDAEKKRLEAFLLRQRPGSHAFFVIPPDPPLRELVLPWFRGRSVSVIRPEGGDEIVAVTW